MSVWIPNKPNRVHTIISPLKVCYYITKKGEERWATLNLNQYRNTQGHQLGLIKEKYTEFMLSKVAHLPKLNKIKLTYILFTGSNHKSDVMNWVAVIDKFFQDTLVKAGKLTDDNYIYVPEIFSKFGSIDKSNPRVEILIEEL